MSRTSDTIEWIFRPGPFLRRRHAEHGDAFTIEIGREPEWLVLVNPDDIKQVFTGDPEVFHAGEANEILLPVVGSRSVLLLDGPEHLSTRKQLLPPFHGEMLKRWEAVMAEVTERHVASWPVGEPVSVLPLMQELTLEIISRTVFGSADPALRESLRTMMDVTTGPRGIAMMVALGPRRVGSAPVWKGALDRVGRRLEDVPDTGIAHDQLLTMLVAGHETTATALSWALERLSRHPEAWARLREDDGWAEAVVRETLRLRPVLPVVVRTLKQDVEIAGRHWPAGKIVAPCIYLLHRRPDLYPDPLAFRPERFLGVKPGTYTWIPFGGGIRRCIGAAFAEMEMRIVLRALASHVEAIRPDDGGNERVRRRAITFTPSRGGRVAFAGVRARPAAASNGAHRSAPAAAPGPTG